MAYGSRIELLCPGWLLAAVHARTAGHMWVKHYCMDSVSDKAD